MGDCGEGEARTCATLPTWQRTPGAGARAALAPVGAFLVASSSARRRPCRDLRRIPEPGPPPSGWAVVLYDEPGIEPSAIRLGEPVVLFNAEIEAFLSCDAVEYDFSKNGVQPWERGTGGGAECGAGQAGVGQGCAQGQRVGQGEGARAEVRPELRGKKSPTPGGGD